MCTKTAEKRSPRWTGLPSPSTPGVVSVIGASGCGKLTLLSVLEGLQEPMEGSVRIGVERVCGPGPERSVVFLVVLPEAMFSAPGAMFAQIGEDCAKILTGIGASLMMVAQGFVSGTAAALAIGLPLGFHARSARSAGKVVAFLSAIPPIVYIPYGIALLPAFHDASVMVIFLATFWPVLTSTLAGVSGVDKRILDAARVLAGILVIWVVITAISLGLKRLQEHLTRWSS